MTIRVCTVVLLLVCAHVFAAEPSFGPIIEGYGPALKSLLSDSAYRTRFGIENPNTELLDNLASAGVRYDDVDRAAVRWVRVVTLTR